jgi:hypothetical protein
VAGESKYGLWNRLWRGIYDLMAIAWYQKRRLPSMATMELAPSIVPQSRGERPAWHNIEVSARVPELQPVEPE